MQTLGKTLLLILFFVTNSTLLFADGGTSEALISGGIGMGSALAMIICWWRTNSVLTTILAGIFGWLYVIYFLIIRDRDEQED